MKKLIIFMLALIFLMGTASAWTVGLNNRLVDYYNFENTSVGTYLVDIVVDNSTRNGTIIGAPTNASGRIGDALNFTTGDYANMVHNISSGDGSLCFWGHSSSETLEWAWGGFADGTNSYGGWSAGATAARSVIAGTALNSNGTATANDWNYWCTTWGVGGAQFYENGEIVATDVTTDYPSTYGGYWIGGREGDDTHTTYLVVDEFGVWERKLTFDEIVELYNGGAGLTYGGEQSVSLYSPADALLTDQTTLNFTANYTSVVNQWVNGTYYLWYSNGTLYNTATIGVIGFTNSTIQNFSNIPVGNYIWNVLGCTTSTCDFAPTNRTLIVNGKVNAIGHSTQTYQTAYENFSIEVHIPSGSTVTSPKLSYDGVNYTVTSTANSATSYNFSRFFNIPLATLGNISLKWFWKIDGVNFSSDTYYQQVNVTILALCNNTYTTPFINYSFQDEGDLSTINATIPSSTFTYYLGDGTLTKTLSFTNNTANFNYTFCSSVGSRDLKVDPVIQYDSTGYPQRTYDPSLITINSTMTSQILYLLGTVDGLYVTFQVVNSAQQPLSGVNVNATRTISGSTVVVGQGTTDATGGVTFWLNPNFLHSIGAFKEGYASLITSITPTQTSYTITLGSTTSSVIDYYQGIINKLYPTLDFLDNNTLYNFSYQLVSTYWDVQEYGFSVYHGNGTLINDINDTTNGGILHLNNINVTGDSVYARYYYVINDTYIYSYSARTWITYGDEGREFSIWQFFNDLDTYLTGGLLGMDNFGRVLLSFIMVVMIVGSLSFKYGMRSDVFALGIMFGVIAFLDFGIGFFPQIKFGDVFAIPYFPTLIAGVVLIAFMAKETQT